MLLKSPPSKRSVIKLFQVLIWAAIFSGVIHTTTWQLIEYKAFDALSTYTAENNQELPIYIIGIDDASMQVLDLRWPWPRNIHAQLIDRLTEGGASIIAFDILFDHATTQAEDTALANAIARSSSPVILAAARTKKETTHGTFWTRMEPTSVLLDAGAITGLVNLEFDADITIRDFPDNRDAFWRVTLKKAVELIPEIKADLSSKSGELIRFLGPDRTFTYIPYYQALDPDKYLQPEALDGALILVGRATAAAADIGAAQVDIFSTPMTLTTGRLTPGVEIHATLIENAVRGLSIRPTPQWGVYSLLVLIATLSTLAVWRFQLIKSALYLILLVSILLILAWTLFVEFRLWLPIIAPIVLLFLVYGTSAITSILYERRHKHEIRKMFSLYVPDKLVEQITKQHTDLKLGGEHREITILFTDLAGFTSASELLPPTDVAKLLNEYFQEMSDILFRYDGTLDKFIGDAIMAFWGAPIADPEHASKGLLAATEMLAAMPKVNQRLKKAGFESISMRMGLHTGTAMVGNLGSTSRFSYTAIGDSVNLAARLEGVNKQYGTELLISESTAMAAHQQIPLRRVDCVRVKGKSQSVELYTLAQEKAVSALSDKALMAYREGHWAESTDTWRKLLEQCPDDPIAPIYLHRLQRLEGQVCTPGWDWSVTLERK